MTYDFLVVGAGISGLGLAHLSSKRNLRTLVLEAAPKIGGCIATHVFPDTSGFWTEAGAHTCYNSYGNLLTIIADLGMTSKIKAKSKLNFKLLRQDNLYSVFEGLHPWELALHIPHIIWASKNDRSIKDYYSQVLGSKNYCDLFGPAFNAVLCQPADEFPAELLFRRKPRQKNIPRSFTLPQGISSIPKAIATQPNLEVLTEVTVVRIERAADSFRAITADGSSFTAKKLALATPPDQAALMLADTFPELAGLLSEISMAEITSVSVAVPKESTTLPQLAGIIAPYEPFYSAVSRDYLEDPKYRGFTFHFPTGQIDPSRQIGRIREILGIPKEQLTAIAYTHNHRLPALRPNHMERITRIDQVLAGTGARIALAGNYFLGVSVEDCLIRSTNEWRRLHG
jgi:protoporphyrinogen oxidase